MPDKENNLSEAWSDDLESALNDYHAFRTQKTPLEAKDFTAYHNACKAVLAHILMIKKMMNPMTQQNPETDFLNLLEQARKANHDENDENDSFD